MADYSIEVSIPSVAPSSIDLTTSNDVEITDAAKGLILKTPGGTRYRVTIDNSGILTATAL